MWMEIAHSFQNGDGYVFFMLGLAFIGTIVIFERYIMLQFVFNIDFSKFLTNLKKMIKAEDLDRAITFCRSSGKTSLPLISLRALEAAETDPSSVRGMIEEEAISFLPRLEIRLGVLSIFATLILLAGILGTINALWTAFHAVEVLDTAQKQALAGTAIADSLTYSAMGIVICMVFLAANHFLKGMAMQLAERIHFGVAVLNNLLVPQEMAYVAAPSGGSKASGAGMESVAAPAQSVSTSETSAPTVVATNNSQESDAGNEDLEEASVEDIKDEEEII